MKKRVVLLLAIMLLLFAGCGQGSYEGKTITYIDESTMKSISVWYEVPGKWDSLDKLSETTFIPNKDDTIIVAFTDDSDYGYDSFVENCWNYNAEQHSNNRYAYSEEEINGHRVLKSIFYADGNSTYRYVVEIENKGLIVIQTNAMRNNQDPYEKPMKHIAETIKVV